MKKLCFSLVLLAGFITAQAQTQFSFALSSAQEVPVNGSGAGGFANLTLNPNNTITYNVSYGGLVGDWTASHIHGPDSPGALAGPGINSGVLFPLINSPIGTRAGTLSGTTAAYTPQQIQDLLQGLQYVNIHSTVFPGGEIRGQIVVPEPSLIALLGLGAGLLFLGLRKRCAA